jgi:hypothetical protein
MESVSVYINMYNHNKLTYNVFIEKELLNYKSEFIKTVYNILNDENGWKIPCEFIENAAENECDFDIHLITHKNIIGKCKTLYNMSCVNNLGGNKIYVNINRWVYGSVHSKLNIEQYRSYIINHEFGHLLNQNHCNPPNNAVLTPIMVQQTLGIGNGRPNFKPLPEERAKMFKEYELYILRKINS